MRLIDADALYYKVKCECNPYGKPTIDFESGNKVLDWIEKAPTIPTNPCKFRSPINCDFCAFHSDCDEHWKEGESD